MVSYFLPSLVLTGLLQVDINLFNLSRDLIKPYV